MMIKDLVSVLMPCYNHETYVINALDSIKKNDYPLKEIILIDDGSKDQSFEAAKEYLDHNQEFFYGYKCLKQENHGVTKTLNKMISLAQGEFIALLASDDYLTENSLRDRVEYLKKHTHKQAVIGKAFLVDETNQVLNDNAGKKLYRANSKMLLSNFINKELIMRWSVVGPTLLLKRTVYDEIGMYNENLKIEDREFYLRLIDHNLIGYIDKNVACYRVHSSNASRTQTIEQRAGLLVEICEVNIKYSQNDFCWDEKIFLASYKVDKALIQKGYFKLLLLHKAIRAVLNQIYLFLISRKYSVRKGIDDETNS